MVRHVKSISEELEPESQPRQRHFISHPPDNIGVSCTVQTNSSNNIPGRRRSLAVPRDNIGVACLPNAERLGNILEVPEYEPSGDEDGKKTSRIERVQTSDKAYFARGRSCKRRDTVGLLCHEPGKEFVKERNESKKAEHKLLQPIEMGISNMRRPREDPTKPRKLILPRDNIGIACRPLHRSTGRLSGPRLSTGVNLKSSTNGMERKSHHNAKPSTLTRKERVTGEQIKTLRAVSKLSVLLLYIHFLLTYYLSFSKSHRYGEIFDSCPPQNVYE